MCFLGSSMFRLNIFDNIFQSSNPNETFALLPVVRKLLEKNAVS